LCSGTCAGYSVMTGATFEIEATQSGLHWFVVVA
jgi:hypothetical protein